MKRWLAILLLTIAVAGTFVPCYAIEGCCADQIAGTANHDNHEEKGNCSPFFTCGTCPGFIQQNKSIEIPKMDEPAQCRYPDEIPLRLSSYSASLLQPPRAA